MNVCLIGDFSPQRDEGYKNISHALAGELALVAAVARLDVKRLSNLQAIKTLLAKTDVFHAISQPTLSSLLFLAAMRITHPGAAVVLSALRPEKFQRYPPWLRKFVLKLARPDLVFIQSDEAGSLFKSTGCQVAWLPNGVDLERFSPVSPEQKRTLRKKHGFETDSPIILHVGHLAVTRNLDRLVPLVDAGFMVVVAGSVYMGVDQELISQLEKAGLLLIKGYQPLIEELYQLADCYVFPLDPGNSLSMPLSVLEAMACNLPIVATRYPGLVDAFLEGKGIKFIGTAEEIVSPVQEVLAKGKSCATRDQVLQYSWPAIASRVFEFYEGIKKPIPAHSLNKHSG